MESSQRPDTSIDRPLPIGLIEPVFSEAEPIANFADDPKLDPEPVATIAPGEVVVGIFLGFGELDSIFVTHPLRRTGIPQSARSIVPLSLSDIGREVVLNFERGDLARPLIVGRLWKPPQAEEAPQIVAKPAEPIAEPGGDELILTAGKRIVLRCGEASLTLTEEGKVLIQGAYVSSKSTGAHRIKGASVQIN